MLHGILFGVIIYLIIGMVLIVSKTKPYDGFKIHLLVGLLWLPAMIFGICSIFDKES